MKSYATLDGYKNYYGSAEFQLDLIKWFKITMSSTNPQFPIILFADKRNLMTGMPSSTREKSFYFSFCIFLHALQAQAICKLSGSKVMESFHLKTNVPMISCGLGGLMHPAHILLESDLYPIGAEVTAYYEMIDIIKPAIRQQINELSEFASVDKLYDIVYNEVYKFQESLKNTKRNINSLYSEIPTYFLYPQNRK